MFSIIAEIGNFLSKYTINPNKHSKKGCGLSEMCTDGRMLFKIVQSVEAAQYGDIHWSTMRKSRCTIP